MKFDFKKYIFTIIFFSIIILSYIFDFSAGKSIFNNFSSFFITMIKFVPAVFILIGLFDVWVKRETIEKHLGEKSSLLAYFWSLVLAGTTVGGLYVAFPIAAALYRKGARVRIIFTYLGAAAVCRVPMTLFEASYVGLKFTAVRWITSIPLIILSSIFMEKYLEKHNITLIEVSDTAGS
ncbi:MAG: permease [Bacillota bacterium]